MGHARRYLLIALSLVVALTTVTMLAPRTVHAITATLVQVVNNSASPVPTVDAGLRFAAALCVVNGSISSGANFCLPPTNVATFVVPNTTSAGTPVRRLVVDNVSGYCSNYANPGFLLKTVRLRGQFPPDAVNNGNATLTHYVPIVGPVYSYVNDATWGPPTANQAENDYSFGQATHFTFGPGESVTADAFGFLPSLNGAVDYYCVVRVEGELVAQ